MVLPGTLFEEFGFNYIGPIDGHDLDALVAHAAEPASELKGPQFLHVVTTQGQGLHARRGRPDQLPRPGHVRSGERHRVKKTAPASRPTRRSSATGCATWPQRDPRARRHHAGDARRLGPGASSRSDFPERYFDVGIAEQHAVTFAAGLACEGMKPVVAIYSTFLQRALRPADPRRRAAEPAGAVRDRPRRPRRRRRRDARRQLRPRATCAASRT